MYSSVSYGKQTSVYFKKIARIALREKVWKFVIFAGIIAVIVGAVCGKNMVANSKAKLERKNIDMIVANNVKVEGAGFGTDTNVVTIITHKDVVELPLMGKDEVAEEIFKRTL